MVPDPAFFGNRQSLLNSYQNEYEKNQQFFLMFRQIRGDCSRKQKQIHVRKTGT